ncbi:MAG: DUF3387 domain-containing protein [Alistipes sp.]|nr:DUF3387 domain-containing protein [Alistipes sp.]
MELKEESSSGDELGITVQEKAFYDVLDYIITREDFEFDRSVLPDMAREMRECTDKACSVLDWKDRADIRARLKMDLAKIMQRYGFPPVYYNGVYEKVFEQIENYKAHS